MNRLFYPIFTAVLLAVSISCTKDDKQTIPDDEFIVPELTEANTIQFTVNANKSRSASILLRGGKVAVDWGDGTQTKRYEPEKGSIERTDFKHTYSQKGQFRVKIWTEEVSFVSLSGLLRDYSDLHIGNCPVLEYAVFNSLTKGKTITANDCPNIEFLEISNCEELETVSLEKCSNLNKFSFYTNPYVSVLDLRKNDKLDQLHCSFCNLKELLLPKSISDIEMQQVGLTSISMKGYDKLLSFQCINTRQLLSVDLEGCDKLELLDISNTSVASFDFAVFSELRSISCDQTPMNTIDMSSNAKLWDLSCRESGLTSLDITKNKQLTSLDCGKNELTSLDISNNKYLNKLYIDDNKFNKNTLETLFSGLPKRNTTRVPVIKLCGNPGASTANTQILQDKQWQITEN